MSSDYTAYFDVDDTLIVDAYNHTCDDCVQIEGLWFHRHEKHIELMRKHKAEGHVVIVWSQGGATWARQVVAGLGIQDLVDYCLSKPTVYYDDISDPSIFMGKHIFHFKAPADR